jgi:hypothetical protein
MSETSHVENAEAKENSQEAVEVLPLQYTPLEKMLLEKVNEMKFEREELLSLIKELKEELTLFRQAQPNEFPMRPAQPKAQEKAQ